jgi:hypothetical protein
MRQTVGVALHELEIRTQSSCSSRWGTVSLAFKDNLRGGQGQCKGEAVQMQYVERLYIFRAGHRFLFEKKCAVHKSVLILWRLQCKT